MADRRRYGAAVFDVSRPPVLIVGGHRSGTSAVTERLAAMGLFVGARRDSHGESTFFQRLNRRVTSEAGGHWTTPHVVVESLNDVAELGRFSEVLRAYLAGPTAIEYWGLRSSARREASPWGWKDPRNTYLAPLWLSVFGDSRILSVRRDPRASALSLHDRTTALQAAIHDELGAGGGRKRLRPQLNAIRGHPVLSDGWRTETLHGALEVALEYREIQDVLDASHGNVHAVDYEELLESPARVLGAAARFCGLTPSASLLGRQAASITPTRNTASATNVAISAAQRARLATLGYPTGTTSTP